MSIEATTVQRERPSTADILAGLQQHFEASAAARRGLCLLGAGLYEKAESMFRRAQQTGWTDGSLPAFLAASLYGQGRAEDAAQAVAPSVVQRDAGTAAQVRHALLLWEAGRPDDAIASLRHSVSKNPERAELHFQLGTLLSSMQDYEEAELRFTQAINLDRRHTEAWVSLAMCCGLRHAPREAVGYLQTAQKQRPNDLRIAMLLAQAAAAVQATGAEVCLQPAMPDEAYVDPAGVAELASVIQSDPDFVDAFLSISVTDLDKRVYAMLLATIELALERQPEHAELHFHCGQVLDRLGRREDAISATERARAIDPTFARALIELGRLYHRTNRRADAMARLEEAIRAGADYADVHLMLGDLYRDEGKTDRAKASYRRALALNDRYEAAEQALAALAV